MNYQYKCTHCNKTITHHTKTQHIKKGTCDYDYDDHGQPDRTWPHNYQLQPEHKP